MATLTSKSAVTTTPTTKLYGSNGGDDGTIDFSLVDNSKIEEVTTKTTTGAYTLIQSDAGVIVDIDNTPTFTALDANTVLTIYNTTASPISWVLTGITVDNTTLTSISAFGHITVYYKTPTNIRILGETE